MEGGEIVDCVTRARRWPRTLKCFEAARQRHGGRQRGCAVARHQERKVERACAGEQAPSDRTPGSSGSLRVVEEEVGRQPSFANVNVSALNLGVRRDGAWFRQHHARSTSSFRCRATSIDPRVAPPWRCEQLRTFPCPWPPSFARVTAIRRFQPLHLFRRRAPRDRSPRRLDIEHVFDAHQDGLSTSRVGSGMSCQWHPSAPESLGPFRFVRPGRLRCRD